MSPLFAVYCCCLLLPVCVVCGGCVCVVCVCDPGPRSGRWPLVAGRWSLVLGRTPWPPREISGGGGAQARGPDQICLGITRAPASAPGRGRAQRPEPCAAKPEPPDHRARGTRERLSQLAVKASYSASNKRISRFAKAVSEVSFTAPHLILGRSPPVGSAEGRSDGPKLGGPPSHQGLY
jgi:hypothetical protein